MTKNKLNMTAEEIVLELRLGALGQDVLDAAADEIERLLVAVGEARQDALREYGQHKDGCATMKSHDPEDCDCGFAVLA